MTANYAKMDKDAEIYCGQVFRGEEGYTVFTLSVHPNIFLILLNNLSKGSHHLAGSF